MATAVARGTAPAQRTRKGRRLLRRLVFLAVVLLAAGGLAVAYKDRLFAAQGTSYLTAKVGRGDIEDSVLATGILKPVRLVAVGAQVSGRLTSLKVEVGDRVESGALLAEIDSLPQQNALRTAEATLQRTKAERDEKVASLAYAKAAVSRQEKAMKQKAASRDDYEAALATMRETEAQIAALEADILAGEVAVETAQIDLDYTKITAPIDGTVLSVVTQEGQTVNASQSAPTIVILGELGVMRVRAEISEADVVRVKPGQRAYFTIIGDPDRRYETELASIEPAPESIVDDSSISSSSSSSGSTSTEAIYYNGVFDVPNPDGDLRTYMTAEVHIVLGEAQDVLTLPVGALGSRNQDGSYSVQVIGATGAVEPRRVEIGLNDKILAEVRSGLEEGDRVVIGQGSSSGEGAGSRSVRVPRMGL